METLKEKLQIKSEALNLLSKQLELCNKEKMDYKQLIDTLYDKNLSLKKSLYFKQNQVDPEDENFFYHSSDKPSNMKSLQRHNETDLHMNFRQLDIAESCDLVS